MLSGQLKVAQGKGSTNFLIMTMDMYPYHTYESFPFQDIWADRCVNLVTYVTIQPILENHINN